MNKTIKKNLKYFFILNFIFSFSISYKAQDDLIQHLLQKKELHYFEIVTLEPGIQEKLIFALVPLLNNSDKKTSIRIFQILENIDFSEKAIEFSIPILIRTLKNPEFLISFRAERILKKFGPKAKKVVSELRLMLKNQSKSFRYNIISILSKIGPGAKETLPDLIEFFDKENVIYLKRKILESLIEIGTDEPEIILILLNSLNSQNSEMRLLAVKALSDTSKQTEKIISSISKMLHDPEPQIKMEAAYCLGKWENSLKAETFQTISSDEILLLYYFISAIQNCSDPLSKKQMIDYVCNTLEKGNIDLRLHVITALSKKTTEIQTFFPSLLKNLRGKNTKIHKAILELLRKIGPKAKFAILILKDFINTDHEQIFFRTLSVIEAIGAEAKETVPIIIDILKTGKWKNHKEYWSFQASIVKTLGEIGPTVKPFISVITPLINDENPFIKGTTIIALKKITGKVYPIK